MRLEIGPQQWPEAGGHVLIGAQKLTWQYPKMRLFVYSIGYAEASICMRSATLNKIPERGVQNRFSSDFLGDIAIYVAPNP